jgi:MoaA/NifB/PqqE/SkfB family radical SAM enzyme
MTFLQDDLATLRQAWFLRNLLKPGALVRGLVLPLGQSFSLWSDGHAPPPVALGWFLTWACDEGCVFCNVNDPGRGAPAALPPDERRRLLDRIVPPVRIVGLGGGEPLLVDDLADTIRYVHRRGGTVFVPTNGAALQGEVVRSFALAAPEVVAVTLIGDEAVHDAATRRSGSWRRTVAGISRLLDTRNPRKTRVILNCPLSLANGDCLDEIVQTGRRLGVDRVRFTWVSFVDADPGLESGRPSTELGLHSLAVERAERGFVTFQPRLEIKERMAWFEPGGGVRRRCSSLWNTVYLRPDGEVVPCGQRLGEGVGSLLSEQLGAIWNQPRLRRLRRDQREHPWPACRRCCKI